MGKANFKKVILLISFVFCYQLAKAQDNSISIKDKLHAASKFWQEVNYNFVFFDKVNRKQWDSLFRETLIQIIDTKNDYEYFRLMEKFCAYLNDGHTNIYYPDYLSKDVMITNFGDYRLFVSNINNKAIVTRVNESKKDEISVGSEIIKVNGVETQDYLTKFVKPYVSSSTQYALQNQATYELLKGYKGEKYSVTFKTPQGKIFTKKLEHQVTTETEVFPPFKERNLLDYKILENGIHYLSLNSFEDEKIDSLFKSILPEIYEAKKIIIDLRYNGGGNTTIGFNILQYFTNDTILFGSKSITRQHIPTYKAWGAFLTPKDTLQDKPDWDMTKEDMTKSFLMANDLCFYSFPYAPTISRIRDKRINVPVVVLMGNNTASAAEDFLVYADPLPNFTFMGDKSYGSTGQPFLFNLPGGGRARVCTKKDIYPNGKEFVGYGVSPDIYVSYTFEDYLNSNDPVFNSAIKYLNEK